MHPPPQNGALRAHPSATARNGSSQLVQKTRRELSGVRSILRPRLWFFTRLAALLPAFTFPTLRARLYRWAGCDLQGGTALLGSLRLVGTGDIAPRLTIAEGATIGPGVILGLDATISIGRNVSIGPQAVLYTATHALGFGSQRMRPEVAPRPILVEDGVWIGMHCLIMPGVVLGRGSVVSAGAVVTQDVPPNTLVAGNPAVVQQVLPFGDR